VRRAEGELSAEAAAAARNKAAAEAEENEYSAADQSELNQMKRKQAEEEAHAQTQHAAENAAAEAIRKEQEQQDDEAVVEAELDEAGCEAGARREALRQSKLDCRKTDRELGSLKGKIQQLQVQLRLQHVKNLQTANGETRRLQNRLQSQFLACCQAQGLSAQPEPANAAPQKAPTTPFGPVKPKAEAGYQQELENIRRSLSAENSENKKSQSPAMSPKAATPEARAAEPAPHTPARALLTLLADFVDTSLSDLRSDSSTSSASTSAPEMLACAMKHLGWLLALHPTISIISTSASTDEENENDGQGEGKGQGSQKPTLDVPCTPLALPPDGRSKALWLAALLAPDAIPALSVELKGKLAFLDAICAGLGAEAGKLFNQRNAASFSDMFCTRINSGVAAARRALKT